MAPAYILLFGLAVWAAFVDGQDSPAPTLTLRTEAWYLPTADKAGELFVYEIGTGEPVVALHGGPGADLTSLLPVSNGLEGKYRFVFYDQRGSLRSRAPSTTITMPAHVADLEHLRLALGRDRMNIVSHSAGTLLAFEYLSKYPDRVANLVLVGALPHKNGKKYFDAEYASLWSTLADDFATFRERPAVQEELKRHGLNAPVKTARQVSHLALIRQVGAEMVHVERWSTMLPQRVNPEAARSTRATTTFEYDYGELLARHGFKVTVINGEFDYTVGPRGSPLWKRLSESVAPKVQVVVIPDASHLVWRDQPERFRESLDAALSLRKP